MNEVTSERQGPTISMSNIYKKRTLQTVQQNQLKEILERPSQLQADTTVNLKEIWLDVVKAFEHNSKKT